MNDVRHGDRAVDPVCGMTIAPDVVTENSRGYRYGVSLVADRPLSKAWHAIAGFDLAREEAETWNGRREEQGNLGRTDALACLGVARRAGRAGSVSFIVKLPVVTRATGAQLGYPALVPARSSAPADAGGVMQRSSTASGGRSCGWRSSTASTTSTSMARASSRPPANSASSSARSCISRDAAAESGPRV